jgi:hypothetical protein
MRRRLRPIPIAALAAGATLLLAACGGKDQFRPNVAPETSLFIQGEVDTLSGMPTPADTVNHVVHLFWFGTDPDGEVVRFEYRFVFQGEDEDTVRWHGTLDTDHVFTVPTPTGYAMPRFEVRAVDDDSLRDASPARQDFQFSNLAPQVRLVGSPPVPANTYATVTVQWIATDADGDAEQVAIRAWLDGHEADPHVLPPGTTSFTFPSDDFENPGGGVVSGPRTLFIQAIDDGGRLSTPATATWNVMSTDGAKVLLVDDVPSGVPSASIYDAFYRTTLDGHLPGQYKVLDLEVGTPFRSMKDMEQTFKLFPAVVWYRETNPSFSTLLHDYRPAIEAYLRDGPNSLFLTGLGLFEGENPCGPSGANCGPLPLEFAREFLDTDYFIKAPIATRVDSTVAWTTSTTRVLCPVYADSMRSRAGDTGLRGFGVRSPGSAAVIAPPGTLNQPHPYEIPIGVRVVQPSGGKAIVFSFPLRRFDGYNSHTRILQKVLDDMVLGMLP